jgi:hypothetical protein
MQGFLDWNRGRYPNKTAEFAVSWARKLCLFRAGNEFILGANLFTNLKPTRAQCLQNMTNPLTLAAAHRTLMLKSASMITPTMPVLAIVAANQECCGQAGLNLDQGVARLQAFYAPDFDKTAARDKTRRGFEINPERLDEAEDEIVAYFKSLGKIEEDKGNNGGGSDDLDDGNGPLRDGGGGGAGTTGGPLNNSGNGSITTGSPSSNDQPINHDMGVNPSNTSGASMVMSSHSDNHDMGTSFNTLVFQPLARVKAENSALDDPSPIPEMARHKFSIKVIDTPLTASKEGDYANAISAISMVIWTDGQISQFTGGDADWASEMKVVSWVLTGMNPYQSARSIKISHHGAKSSTPTEMIRHFRPRNIVISCGDDYGHPRMFIFLTFSLIFRNGF